MIDWQSVLLFSLPPSLLFLITLSWVLWARARERRTVRQLLDIFKEQETALQSAAEVFLSTQAHQSGEKLAHHASAIQTARRDVQKAALTALLERSASATKNLADAIACFAAAYHALETSVPTVPDVAPVRGAEDAVRMREENERLKREVQVTLGTLNNIFAEYASMFGNEHSQRDMSVEQILSSMQALTEGSVPAPASELDALDDAPVETLMPAEVAPETVQEMPEEIPPDRTPDFMEEPALPPDDLQVAAETSVEDLLKGSAGADAPDSMPDLDDLLRGPAGPDEKV